MDTKNDGLEKVAPFKNGNSWVSMLDFWGVSFSRERVSHFFNLFPCFSFHG